MKLEIWSQVWKGVLIGYQGDGTTNYRIFRPENKSIYVTHDVVFNENEFPFKEAQALPGKRPWDCGIVISDDDDDDDFEDLSQPQGPESPEQPAPQQESPQSPRIPTGGQQESPPAPHVVPGHFLMSSQSWHGPGIWLILKAVPTRFI